MTSRRQFISLLGGVAGGGVNTATAQATKAATNFDSKSDRSVTIITSG